MHNQNIHTKTAFREDVKYAREMLRRIEIALRGNDWEAVADECNELEPLFSSMRCRATDNVEGIEDFACKYPDEIEAIRNTQKAVA